MSEPLARPRPDWWLDAGLGFLALLLGLVEVLRLQEDEGGPLIAVVVLAMAVALWRQLPGPALGVVWLLGAFHLATATPFLVVESAVALVAFGTARWGRSVTVALGGLSIPAAGVVGVAVVFVDSDLLQHLVIDLRSPNQLGDAVFQLGDRWPVALAVVAAALLGTPWTAGLAVRFLVRARSAQRSEEEARAGAALAQREAVQAQEIAELRDGQARLARDVHDVVGHSLAVILAQADSAQYLPDDPEALRRTMATIATSARSSLQDVGQVLATTSSDQPVRPGSLTSLVEGVRATGHEVVDDEVGTPRPLPPDVEVVAYRVLQEMLTNAVRHGRRDRTVRIERRWPGTAQDRELALTVSNGTLDAAAPEADARAAGGQGIPGMRRRVESVGGRLDVRSDSGPDGPTFTATAWVPVRV